VLSEQPERRQPLPTLWGVPGHLVRGLTPGRRRLAIAGLAVLLLGVAAAGVFVVPSYRAQRDAQQAAQARRAAADRATLLARLDREARPHAGAGPAAAGVPPHRAVAVRGRLLDALEADVLVDARARVRQGELEGAYRSATCFEFPKRLTTLRPEQLVHRPRLRVECIAASSEVAPSRLSSGSLIGVPYRAKVDFARGRFAWCKIVQRPGELSIQQAQFRVPKACSR
jgi:type II secretory pathway component PulM